MPGEVESLHYVNNARLAKTGLPWHGLGNAHDRWMTDEEAKEALNWRIQLMPNYWQNPETGIYLPNPDSQTVVKVVDGHPKKAIATVGNIYTPWQNDELIELGSILVDDFGAKWDTVGSLRGDRIVFATLRLDVVSEEGRGLAELEGSDYWCWLLLTNTHDGSARLTGDVVKVRTVCMNTLRIGRESARAGWAVRHSGDMRDRAIEAHRQIGLATRAEQEFSATALQLAETEIVLADFEALTEHLFPTQSEEVGPKALVSNKRAQAAVTRNWLTSETISAPIRNTKWGAFNAVTEWAEHQRPVRSDRRVPSRELRMLSTVMGGPVSQIRDKAFSYLTK